MKELNDSDYKKGYINHLVSIKDEKESKKFLLKSINRRREIEIRYKVEIK